MSRRSSVEPSDDRDCDRTNHTGWPLILHIYPDPAVYRDQRTAHHLDGSRCWCGADTVPTSQGFAVIHFLPQ